MFYWYFNIIMFLWWSNNSILTLVFIVKYFLSWYTKTFLFLVFFKCSCVSFCLHQNTYIWMTTFSLYGVKWEFGHYWYFNNSHSDFYSVSINHTKSHLVTIKVISCIISLFIKSLSVKMENNCCSHSIPVKIVLHIPPLFAILQAIRIIFCDCYISNIC